MEERREMEDAQRVSVSRVARIWGFGPVSGPRASRARILQGGDTLSRCLTQLHCLSLTLKPPSSELCSQSHLIVLRSSGVTVDGTASGFPVPAWATREERRG